MKIRPLPLSSSFYSKYQFVKFCVVEREIWSAKLVAFVFSQTVLPTLQSIALDGLDHSFLVKQ